MMGVFQEAGFDLLSTHSDDFRPPKAKGIRMDCSRREDEWERAIRDEHSLVSVFVPA